MFFKTPFWDLKLFWLINESWRNPFFDFIMPLLSNKLLGFLLLGIIFVLLLGQKNWSKLASLLLLLILLGFCDFSVNFPKEAIGRVRPLNALAQANFWEDGKWQKRPANFRAHKPKGHSYPSAHAANSLLLGCSLAFLFRKQRFFFWLLPLGVGFSRVYLAKHYPLDVLAGYLWGTMFYLLFLILIPFFEAVKWERLLQKKSLSA